MSTTKKKKREREHKRGMVERGRGTVRERDSERESRLARIDSPPRSICKEGNINGGGEDHGRGDEGGARVTVSELCGCVRMRKVESALSTCNLL